MGHSVYNQFILKSCFLALNPSEKRSIYRMILFLNLACWCCHWYINVHQHGPNVISDSFRQCITRPDTSHIIDIVYQTTIHVLKRDAFNFLLPF